MVEIMSALVVRYHEAHLPHVLRAYADYYTGGRTHLCSSKSRTPQKPWLSGHRPDSLSAMRKRLILLLVALLHRLDRALAA